MAGNRRTRMYEPWGYREENNYQGDAIIMENDLESFFSDAQYKDEDKSIHFYNKDGEEKATLDVTQFAPSVVESAVYDKNTKILTITFSNGDKVEINLAELIDENEFADGLVVDGGGIVKVLIDSTGEPYLSVGENGVKISGVDQAIADAVDAEKTRAEAAEQALQDAIDAETERATAAEEAEQTRAEAAEQTLDAKIDQEIADRTADVDAEETRAKAEEQALSRRNDTLNDELDAEESIREAGDVALGRRIDQEIDDREADVDEEEARAKAAEEALQAAIDAEAERATSAETALQAAIEAEGQRAQDAEQILGEKIEAETERAEIAESAITEAIVAEAERIDQEIASLNETKFDNAIYNSVEKEIYFYAAGEVVSTIDTSAFIIDGMVEDVRIEDGNLVIDFNTASGIEDIEIPLTDIFNPDNYYDKDAIDEIVSGITQTIEDNEYAISTALNDLNDRKLDASAYTPTDLSDYYTKSETSGATEISNALDDKASKTDDLDNIKLKKISQSDYDNLVDTGTVDANTLYIIRD